MKIFPAILLILVLSLFMPAKVLADDIEFSPIEIVLEVENTTIIKGESTNAIITINNNTPFEISTKIVAKDNNALFLKDKLPTTIMIPPYSGYEKSFEISGNKVGDTRLAFSVTYNWVNSTDKQRHQRTEIVKSEQINITGFKIDWPNYLIPLLIGFALSQTGSWLTEYRKQQEENLEKQEQAVNLTLAMLNIAKKGIERHEPISIGIWEDLILKGNLYTHLVKLSKKIKMPELTKRLASLSVLISEYNTRQKESTLTEDFIIDLTEELQSLIKIIGQSS